MYDGDNLKAPPNPDAKNTSGVSECRQTNEEKSKGLSLTVHELR